MSLDLCLMWNLLSACTDNCLWSRKAAETLREVGRECKTLTCNKSRQKASLVYRTNGNKTLIEKLKRKKKQRAKYYQRVPGRCRQEQSWTSWRRCPRTRESAQRWVTSWREPWRTSSGRCAVPLRRGRPCLTRLETRNHSEPAMNSGSYVRLSYECIDQETSTIMATLKPGFHYPSWRAVNTARVDG